MSKLPILHFEVHREPDGTYRAEGQRQNGEAECPRCGQWVPLVEDVVEWYPDTGEVPPWGWGPGQAVCCGLLVASWWEGTFVYDLADGKGAF